MITQNRRLEFWNFLTAEKNQPRPKGITMQRLAVIRQAILVLDEVWLKIIGPDNPGDRSAADFYGSKEPESVISRAEFWSAVRKFIKPLETKTFGNPTLRTNRRKGRDNQGKAGR